MSGDRADASRDRRAAVIMFVIMFVIMLLVYLFVINVFVMLLFCVIMFHESRDRR